MKTIHPLLSHYSSTKCKEGRGAMGRPLIRRGGGALIRGGAQIRRFTVTEVVKKKKKKKKNVYLIGHSPLGLFRTNIDKQ